MIKPLKWGFKMSYDLKSPDWSGQKILICLIIIGILIVFLPIFEPGSQEAEADLVLVVDEVFLLRSLPSSSPFANARVSEDLNGLAIIEGNSLLPVSEPTNPEPQPVWKIRVVITGYSSTPWETDDDPYITAAGTWVREGIVANNWLSIGTKIKIPELFGDRIFVVEDRMSWTKGNYHIDIWFPSYWEALNFGAKRTYIEILEG